MSGQDALPPPNQAGPGAPPPQPQLPNVANPQPHAGPNPVPLAVPQDHQIQKSNGEIKLPPHMLLDFGATRSDYTRVDFTIAIANQDTMPTAVWEQLKRLEYRNIGITQAVFTKIWKTMILKRAQDLFQQTKNRRPDNFVRVYTNLPVPKPLYDLLCAMGQCYDNTNGITYDILPPPRDAAHPQDWYELQPNELNTWVAEMRRYGRVYEMCEFPQRSDFEGRALQRLDIEDDNALRQVKARSTIVRPSDALITFMHDAIFTAGPGFANCHIICTDKLHRTSVVASYVGSFVKNPPTI